MHSQRRRRVAGELRKRVKVLSIADSRIPRVKIIELGGNGLKVSMDLHSELLVFGEGEELEMIISKNIPAYKEGRDFCAKGVVVSIKDGERVEKVIISLWGYLVILNLEDSSLLEGFELHPTDQIYYCLIKQS
jgi:hypothetical protein